MSDDQINRRLAELEEEEKAEQPEHILINVVEDETVIDETTGERYTRERGPIIGWDEGSGEWGDAGPGKKMRVRYAKYADDDSIVMLA